MKIIRTESARRFLFLAAVCWAVVPARGQIIITNFSGLTLGDTLGLGTGSTPPDTMGAAGTNQFVEFINGGFAVYGKSGARQSLVSDHTFWLNAGISAATMSAGLTDPRIIYDAGSGRWFATELTVDATANKVLVARSNSSNPSGTWKGTNFQANTGFGDYDTLGVDALGVYIGVNNFNNGGVFTGVSFFSIPKADLLAATPTLANMTRFDNINDQVYGFTLQGVVNSDAGISHGVIIAIDNAAFNFIDRTTINGSGAAGATLSSRVRISNTYDASPSATTQPGGQAVDALDDRFSGAVRQAGGYIFMANTVLQGSKDAVHWMILNETNNVLVGEGIISDASYDFFQPSIAANHHGNILLAFNRCGTANPAGDISIYAAVGSVTNGVAAMGSPFVLKPGTVSNFAISFDSPPYRWGDYSATMVDPTDDNLLWTIQEIPASSSSWGTQITLISMATNRPTLGITRSGSSAQITWPLSTDPAYLLQSNTNLLATNAWITVANAPVISINQNMVTQAIAAGPVFFRLKK
jgi:hypothetical protein